MFAQMSTNPEVAVAKRRRSEIEAMTRGMKVRDLKAVLKSCNCRVGGLRQDLIDRIKEAAHEAMDGLQIETTGQFLTIPTAGGAAKEMPW